MGVSEWDLLVLFPLDYAWKWGNRPSRFGFRTFSDGFCGSKFTGFNSLWMSSLLDLFAISGINWNQIIRKGDCSRFSYPLSGIYRVHGHWLAYFQ